jgi:hypothetical protein
VHLNRPRSLLSQSVPLLRMHRFIFIHSQALIVQDGPLASLSVFLDHTHTDTR